MTLQDVANAMRDRMSKKRFANHTDIGGFLGQGLVDRRNFTTEGRQAIADEQEAKRLQAEAEAKKKKGSQDSSSNNKEPLTKDPLQWIADALGGAYESLKGGLSKTWDDIKEIGSAIATGAENLYNGIGNLWAEVTGPSPVANGGAASGPQYILTDGGPAIQHPDGRLEFVDRMHMLGQLDQEYYGGGIETASYNNDSDNVGSNNSQRPEEAPFYNDSIEEGVGQEQDGPSIPLRLLKGKDWEEEGYGSEHNKELADKIIEGAEFVEKVVKNFDGTKMTKDESALWQTGKQEWNAWKEDYKNNSNNRELLEQNNNNYRTSYNEDSKTWNTNEDKAIGKLTGYATNSLQKFAVNFIHNFSNGHTNLANLLESTGALIGAYQYIGNNELSIPYKKAFKFPLGGGWNMNIEAKTNINLNYGRINYTPNFQGKVYFQSNFDSIFGKKDQKENKRKNRRGSN